MIGIASACAACRWKACFDGLRERARGHKAG
jgi:hypothetical protein